MTFDNVNTDAENTPSLKISVQGLPNQDQLHLIVLSNCKYYWKFKLSVTSLALAYLMYISVFQVKMDQDGQKFNILLAASSQKANCDLFQAEKKINVVTS